MKQYKHDRLQRFFPSNDLRDLRNTLEKMPASRLILKDLIQIWFVVDASIIQGELRWRLGSRDKPNARSGFHESIEAGLFVAIAPFHLRAEIEEHLHEIAADENTTLEEARKEWESVQGKLHFYQPASTSPTEATTDRFDAATLVDPDDLAYKATSDELGIPIYSPDAHFRRMNVQVIAIRLDLTARKYARAASVTTSITVHATTAVIFSVGTIHALCELIRNLFKFFFRLPRGVQLLVGFGLIAILLHPRMREKLVARIRSFCDGIVRLKPEVVAAVADLFQEVGGLMLDAAKAGEEIRDALPAPRKRTALMHARAILATSTGPLTLDKLAGRVQGQGYSSRAKDFGAYLRRVMRASGQFVEASPGMWSLKVT